MVDPGVSNTLEVAQCPSWAASLGYMGVAAAVCLSNWGSAVSTVLVCFFCFFFVIVFILLCVLYSVCVVVVIYD